MPLIKNPNAPVVVEAPKSPHLALLTNAYDSPEWMPIPTGTIMGIILDPSDAAKGIFPLALMHVGKSRLLFKCPCGQAACDRKVVFNGTWSGIHPKGTAEINMKK